MRVENIDVSIIIVSYNTRDLLVPCLASITKAQTKADHWEVIVVDNGSSDGSVQAISDSRFTIYDLRIIQNTKNVGFAKANNQGIKEAKGKYILLLNSDTEVEKGSIQSVYAFLEAHKDVGVATCKLLLPDGRIDPASHRGFPTPWAAFTYFAGLEKLFPKSPFLAQYHQWYKDMKSVHEIDSPSGAFFMVRQSVIDKVGLLDEGYFMYAEDLDWSYRIKQAGWKIMFLPQATALHKKKQSGRGAQDKALRLQTDRHFYRTMLQFYDKHFRSRYSSTTTFFVHLAIGLRLQLLAFGV